MTILHDQTSRTQLCLVFRSAKEYIHIDIILSLKHFKPKVIYIL